MSLGERIRDVAAERNLSLNRLAVKANLARPYLNKILAGKLRNPGIENVARIANALEVSVDYLLQATCFGCNGGGTTDPEALAGPKGELIEFPTGAKPIVVHRLSTAAGSGALDLDESIKTYAWFRSEWLSRKGLVADQCAIISVTGESMKPALPDGCVILIDRNRTRRRDGHIFVVRTEDGLVVKRLGKDKKGHWLLVSDHPEWKSAPWPEDAVIIGEVKWSAVEW